MAPEPLVEAVGDDVVRGHTIAKLLASGGVVLIVGAKSGNATHAMREHRRFVWWDSDWAFDNQDVSLPSNARYVLCLRFCSHQTSAAVLREARKRGIAFEWLGSSTGRLRLILGTVMKEIDMPTQYPQRTEGFVNKPVLVDAKSSPAPEPPEAAVRAERGALKQALELLDSEGLINRTAAFSAEATRLIPILAQRGIHTSFGSVDNALRNYGYITRKRPVDEKVVAAVVEADAPRLPPSGPVTPVVPAVLKPTENTQRNFDALLKMIDDLAASAELLKDFVLDLKKREVDKQAMRDKLREVMENL